MEKQERQPPIEDLLELENLLTLKDLEVLDGDCSSCFYEYGGGRYHEYESVPCVEIKELKQMVTEWIKFYGSSFYGEPINDYALLASINVLKHIFNLTPEDLK